MCILVFALHIRADVAGQARITSRNSIVQPQLVELRHRLFRNTVEPGKFFMKFLLNAFSFNLKLSLLKFSNRVLLSF